MNTNWETLIPMCECYRLPPQAACWATGNLSTETWQVIDIKELRDSEVVVGNDLMCFYEAFDWYFCDIATGWKESVECNLAFWQVVFSEEPTEDVRIKNIYK